MKRVLFGLGVTISSAAVAVACSSSSNPATPSNNEDSGLPDSSTPGPDTGTTTPDSGTTPDTGTTAPDGGVACNPGATLYDRLGGYTGIHSALVAIVGKELQNADIASYFFNQVASPVPAGHPTAAQIEDCFSVLLAQAAGGPFSYPPDGGVTDDAGGGTFVCRDMATIHQPLLISGGTFDEFVSIAAATLAPTVCTADLTMIGTVLDSTRSAIVFAPLADAGLQPFPGDGGAEQ